MANPSPARLRRILFHAGRAALLVTIVALIRWQHLQRAAHRTEPGAATVTLQEAATFFPQAASLGERLTPGSGRAVLDASGNTLGYVLQTSPDSDHIIGFSGPTNVVIAFGTNERIAGAAIRSSGDTRDHVEQVRSDDRFLSSFRGLAPSNIGDVADIDAVSGATLTSRAVQESVIHRLGGAQPSLRFPDPLTVEDARELFPDAGSIVQDPSHDPLWRVRDEQDVSLGSILRTSPAADNVIGYQGPTEARIAFGRDGRVLGLALGNSYDNEPYVSYVREDEYFLTRFDDLVLDELAELNPEDCEVEGVSGATMTSMAVTESMIVAAQQHQQALAEAKARPKRTLNWKLRDWGAALIIAAGLIIGLSSLRSNKLIRVTFQLLLIGYLGLINGDMISQAMFVGWARHGIPWRSAGSLVLLTAAALIVPLTTRRNVYCTHLCPHGALQQLLKRRLPWQWHLPARLSRQLKRIPAVLLAWCAVVGVLALPFSLVDIEPFDAWVFRIAGWATLSVAVVGLGASLFIPMAYCRFGCPTGMMLNFLRFNSRSHYWTGRDWLAVGLTLLAAGLSIAW